MSAIANALALKELSAALGAIDAPFSALPEVKDKNGDVITDVKEKRLALVRQHVQAAGDIIHLVEQAAAGMELAVQAALTQKYRPQIEEALKAQGLPMPDDCDCASCTARRGSEKAHNGTQGEPARKFGFAAAVERMEREKAQKKE